MSSLQIITPKEWQHMAHQKDVLLIDLRSPGDFSHHHIEGAINIPYDQLRKIVLFRRKILVLYCEKGITSTAAGLSLAQRGYQVYTLQGGIQAYDQFHLHFDNT